MASIQPNKYTSARKIRALPVLLPFSLSLPAATLLRVLRLLRPGNPQLLLLWPWPAKLPVARVHWLRWRPHESQVNSQVIAMLLLSQSGTQASQKKGTYRLHLQSCSHAFEWKNGAFKWPLHWRSCERWNLETKRNGRAAL
jgi:hypothetical protein